MKKYIVLTLFCSLIGINISVQAMQGGGDQEMGQQCAICICQGEEEEEEEEEENGPLETLPCGHTFHDKCIREWAAKKPICPLCRKDMFVAVADSGRGRASQANPMDLIDAALDGRLEVVQALLSSGALVNRAHFLGLTALHIATTHGNLEVVQALLGATGIQVNTPDTEGDTALHFAASGGNLEVVEVLLRAREIQVNTANENGMTALHYPAEEGYLGIVQALIAAGADVNTPNTDGHTALQLATRNGHAAVVAAIQQHIDRHK